ncbi:MAG: FtsX-like permease family protein [Lachnospiraceae bacterium]|nr:FtsX-like permease family protein [Lachnospiraceae bacterium]
MKSYLSLIPISAKMRKRQNRMITWCIVISVLLVTTIFSVADMFIRTEGNVLQNKHGNWHIKLDNISQDIAEEIEESSDVQAVGWSEAFNTEAEEPCYVGEKKAALYGADNTYLTQLVNAVEEGDVPQSDDEVMLSSNAKLAMEVQVGDSVTIETPAGKTDFTVSGFGSDDREYYEGQTYLVAAYMTREAFTSLMKQNNIPLHPSCYVQFQDAQKASGAIAEMKQQYDLPEESISENTATMGISGQSSNEAMKNIYGLAVILFIMVLLAGVLMISGSMNSNVAQRTKFFGMMRCIGASRRQIIRYVRLEALNWCKTAVPVGLLAGVVISWGICGLLHYGIGGEFATIQVFAFSPVGLISGALVGIVTVLLAAQAPARRAAKASPMAAVSGNSDAAPSVRHTIRLKRGRVENSLGVHHATASKKNWFLMTASFSLSIILFLCFSVGLDFARELMPSMRSWQPDLTLTGYENRQVLSRSLSDTIRLIPGVEHVYGSAYMENVPVTSSRKEIDHVNITSYSDYLLDSAEENIVQGELSEIYGDSDKVMTVMDKDNPIKVGDTMVIAGQEVEVVCAVSNGLYAGEYSIICSRETFARLTGEQNDSMIGIQLGRDATEETVKQISSLAESDVIFADQRERNQEDANAYLATRFVMYSFLAIIAMITLFNIINSISMSVTARMKQYGAMRAVGMDEKQLTGMIAAEAFTYAVSGLVVGGGIGIVLSRFLYTRLLTRYFGIPWRPPLSLLAIVIVFAIVSAIVAVYAPAKRIRSMAITETINEL